MSWLIKPKTRRLSDGRRVSIPVPSSHYKSERLTEAKEIERLILKEKRPSCTTYLPDNNKSTLGFIEPNKPNFFIS
jgi:hypothetical protein